MRADVAADAKTFPVLVRVRTSSIAGAGTSAAVFISLYGTTGEALKQVKLSLSFSLIFKCRL